MRLPLLGRDKQGCLLKWLRGVLSAADYDQRHIICSVVVGAGNQPSSI